MEYSITSAAIATLISAITSAIITILISRSNKSQSLDNQLDAILKIAIQYPYLESEDFTTSWKSDFDRNNEKYLRYDVYGTLVFNYLSRVAHYCKYEETKIEEFIAIKDWVRLHGKYWIDPTTTYGNIDSYNKDFVQLINGLLI